MGSQGAMKETIILTNFEFSSTIIGKVSHLSGGFSGEGLLSCCKQSREESGNLVRVIYRV